MVKLKYIYCSAENQVILISSVIQIAILKQIQLLYNWVKMASLIDNNIKTYYICRYKWDTLSLFIYFLTTFLRIILKCYSWNIQN